MRLAPVKSPPLTTLCPTNDLLVVSGNDHRVQRFSGLNGSFINTFAASGGLGLPIGIMYGLDANLYVASFNGHRVVRFDSLTGANLGDFVTNGSGGLSGPNFMVFRPPVALATSTSLSIARSTTNAVVSWPVKNIPAMVQRATDLSPELGRRHQLRCGGRSVQCGHPTVRPGQRILPVENVGVTGRAYDYCGVVCRSIMAMISSRLAGLARQGLPETMPSFSATRLRWIAAVMNTMGRF